MIAFPLVISRVLPAGGLRRCRRTPGSGALKRRSAFFSLARTVTGGSKTHKGIPQASLRLRPALLAGVGLVVRHGADPP